MHGIFVGMSLLRKNVILAVCFNSDKENADDEDNESAVHARIQVGGGAAGRRSPEYRGGGTQLGLVGQTLFNWVKAKREGRLIGAYSNAMSAEQMEVSRLRAELARVKTEPGILAKATAC